MSGPSHKVAPRRGPADPLNICCCRERKETMLVCRSLQVLLALALLVATASAGDPGCGAVVEPGCDAQPIMVQKVVCVPEWVTEKRVVTTTEYAQEPCTKTITCYKRVAETKNITEEVCVMVPEVRTKTVTCTVCKPVYKTKTCQYQVCVPTYRDVPQTYTCSVPVYDLVDKTYTVMVPTTETRTGVRKVCKVEQSTEMRTVTVDEGQYVTETVEVPCTTVCRVGLLARCRLHRGCGCGCGGCCVNDGCSDCGATDCCGCEPQTTTVCQKVWVPKLVTKEVPVTVCKQIVVDEPCQYNVTVCKPVTKTCKVRVCRYETQTRTRMVRLCDYKTEIRTRTYQECTLVPQEVTRQVRYTVCVPKTVTRTRAVTECRLVPYEKQVTYMVCVPRQVQKEMDVCVCRMVQKTISVPAATECDDDAACVRTFRRCLRRAARVCAAPCEPAIAACCE